MESEAEIWIDDVNYGKHKYQEGVYPCWNNLAQVRTIYIIMLPDEYPLSASQVYVPESLGALLNIINVLLPRIICK